MIKLIPIIGIIISELYRTPFRLYLVPHMRYLIALSSRTTSAIKCPRYFTLSLACQVRLAKAPVLVFENKCAAITSLEKQSE